MYRKPNNERDDHPSSSERSKRFQSKKSSRSPHNERDDRPSSSERSKRFQSKKSSRSPNNEHDDRPASSERSKRFQSKKSSRSPHIEYDDRPSSSERSKRFPSKKSSRSSKLSEAEDQSEGQSTNVPRRMFKLQRLSPYKISERDYSADDACWEEQTSSSLKKGHRSPSCSGGSAFGIASMGGKPNQKVISITHEYSEPQKVPRSKSGDRSSDYGYEKNVQKPVWKCELLNRVEKTVPEKEDPCDTQEDEPVPEIEVPANVSVRARSPSQSAKVRAPKPAKDPLNIPDALKRLADTKKDVLQTLNRISITKAGRPHGKCTDLGVASWLERKGPASKPLATSRKPGFNPSNQDMPISRTSKQDPSRVTPGPSPRRDRPLTRRAELRSGPKYSQPVPSKHASLHQSSHKHELKESKPKHGASLFRLSGGQHVEDKAYPSTTTSMIKKSACRNNWGPIINLLRVDKHLQSSVGEPIREKSTGRHAMGGRILVEPKLPKKGTSGEVPMDVLSPIQRAARVSGNCIFDAESPAPEPRSPTKRAARVSNKRILERDSPGTDLRSPVQRAALAAENRIWDLESSAPELISDTIQIPNVSARSSNSKSAEERF